MGDEAAGLLTGITSAAAIAAGLNQASSLSNYGNTLKGANGFWQYAC